MDWFREVSSRVVERLDCVNSMRAEGRTERRERDDDGDDVDLNVRSEAQRTNRGVMR